jgi:hypothetical protein
MAQIVRESKEDGLREKLSDFFGHYAPTINFKTVDLFSALDGVHFLPVDKNVYLRIQSFVNWTENNFPSIEYSCFLYRYLPVLPLPLSPGFSLTRPGCTVAEITWFGVGWSRRTCASCTYAVTGAVQSMLTTPPCGGFR